MKKIAWSNWIAFTAGMIVTTLTISMSLAWHIAEEKRLFYTDTDIHRQLFNGQIQQTITATTSLKTLFIADQYIDADQFRLLAESLIGRSSFIEAAFYAPRIKSINKTAFELSVQAEGMPFFHIQSPIDPEEYYPIRYFEPFTPVTSRLIGLNISNTPELTSAINKAFASDATIIAGNLGPLINDNEYWLIHPVYSKHNINKVINRKQYGNAVVALSLNLKNLSKEIYNPQDNFILGHYQGNNKVEIYTARTEQKNTLFTISKHYEIPFSGNRFFIDFERGIRLQQILGAHTLIALIIGMTATFLFLLLASHINKRQEAEKALQQTNKLLEQRVQERTADLERKAQQLSLEVKERQQAEEHLAHAQQLTHIGSWQLDLTNHQLKLSAETYRIFEVKPQFFNNTYQQLLNIIHPDDIARVQSVYRQSLKSRKPYKISHRLLMKDGRIKYLDAQGYTLFKNDKLWRSIGTVQDISKRKEAEKALRQTSQRYRSIRDTTKDGFLVIDKQAKICDVNRIYCDISGYSKDELFSMTLYDLDSEDPEKLSQHLSATIHDKTGLFETSQCRKNSENWPVEISISYSPLEDGQFFCFLRDIYERKVIEQLALMHEQLSAIVYHGDMQLLMQKSLDFVEKITNSEIGFFHFVEQDQKNISLQIWSTRTLEEMCFADGKGLHYPVSEAGVWVDCIHLVKPVIHNDYASLTHKKGLPEGHAPLSRVLTVPIIRNNLIVAVIGVGNKKINYTQKDVNTVAKMADMAFDLIERKKAEQHVEHMAFYDLLTGLPNRELLNDRLNQAMAQHQRSQQMLAVCFLDLDGFKPVNDQFGHDTGDSLLIELAQRLLQIMRKGDTLARLGGDEFIILLNNLSSVYESEASVQRILDTIQTPFIIKEHKIVISASIGITIYPMDDNNSDILLRHADQAMYQAKEAGKANYKLFDIVQDKQIRERRNIINDINRALGHNEFILYFQPKIELSTARVVGVEALVRWQHPKRGLITPENFLPFIEGMNEEIVLGELVVQKALEQLQQWKEQDINIPISVNISPKHIQKKGFADFIARKLDAYPKDYSESLELEILETSAIGDISQVINEMNQCSDLGVHFSLDDFGTGYSSLTYFHRLPIHFLKIDQNFVRNMIINEHDLDIVEGVIRLADALKRPVIAEGVETIELGLLLLQLGCQYAQGYGIACPMPADNFIQWLLDWEQETVWHKLTYAESNVKDIKLNVAIFSHQHWLESINQYILSDGKNILPPLDRKQCQFSHWYQGLGQARYSSKAIYPFIFPKHSQLHKMADSLIELVDNGKTMTAKAQLAELNKTGDELTTLLQKLVV